ncbi:hypothetical protein HRbin16_03262 [bacterium HR16]|nr:hypothetical protein HRbin16_03262 [bacterium HR16]
MIVFDIGAHYLEVRDMSAAKAQQFGTLRSPLYRYDATDGGHATEVGGNSAATGSHFQHVQPISAGRQPADNVGARRREVV